jgi:hypothetical protein
MLISSGYKDIDSPEKSKEFNCLVSYFRSHFLEHFPCSVVKRQAKVVHFNLSAQRAKVVHFNLSAERGHFY